jgi:hypothetical protein
VPGAAELEIRIEKPELQFQIPNPRLSAAQAQKSKPALVQNQICDLKSEIGDLRSGIWNVCGIWNLEFANCE